MGVGGRERSRSIIVPLNSVVHLFIQAGLVEQLPQIIKEYKETRNLLVGYH